jgi:DNA repair protein RecO (recombination protein O)
MHWSDDGFILSVRKHGETSAIVTLLTHEHGRHAGLVRGGAGRKARAMLQIGNLVAATWRARLDEQLGNLTCEPLRAYAAEIMSERLPLLALSSAAALVDMSLPDRAPHPEVFADFAVLVDALTGQGWEPAYVRFELALLSALGFGLDLETCAVTGTAENLSHVSPRTGRAVSVGAAAPYRERLLELPPFLRDPAAGRAPGDLRAGLSLTGHFLKRVLLDSFERELPSARVMLAEQLS